MHEQVQRVKSERGDLPCCGRHGVDHHTVISHHSVHLCHAGLEVQDVLQHVGREDHLKRSILKGQDLRVGDACTTYVSPKFDVHRNHNIETFPQQSCQGPVPAADLQYRTFKSKSARGFLYELGQIASSQEVRPAITRQIFRFNAHESRSWHQFQAYTVLF